MRTVETIYDDPAFGELLLSSRNCDRCGYRNVDIQYLVSRGPIRVIYEVTDDQDVSKTYLFRSRTARIYSPELGFSIDPGPEAESMVTTVEGLLLRMRDVAERMIVLNDEEEVVSRLREFMVKLDDALKGRMRFSVIIEDPEGNSMIRPPEGREGRLVKMPLNVTSPPQEGYDHEKG